MNTYILIVLSVISISNVLYSINLLHRSKPVRHAVDMELEVIKTDGWYFIYPSYKLREDKPHA